MPLKIVRNNILEMKVDAIVNPTDYKLSGSGSIDKKIHEAGGDLLKKECEEYGHCDFGDAVLTNAYNLPCKYIIHTVGAFWRDNNDDLEIIKSCYANCLMLAKEEKLKSIAFPLIGTGAFGCPKDLVVNIAINTINSFLIENEMRVFLVLYTKKAVEVTSKLVEDIKSYISDEEVDNERNLEEYLKLKLSEKKEFYEYRDIPLYPINFGETYVSNSIKPKRRNDSVMVYDGISFLDEEPKNKRYLGKNGELNYDEFVKDKKVLNEINNIKDTFASKLLHYIDLFGFKDSSVYKAAQVTKQVFYRVKNYENVSKKTALALCITLPLNLEQVTDLLNSAGYTLSDSNKFDRCIKLIIKAFEGRKELISILKVDYLLDELNIETFNKNKMKK